MTSHSGTWFGPFRLFERLGKGGTASVWRATKPLEDGGEQEVSLKRLHPHLHEDDDAVRRFVNEAEIAAILRHDNICRFYELGCQDGEYFISMEYLDGPDLRCLLQSAHDAKTPLPFAVTLSLLTQLCDALDYAHNLADERTGLSLNLVHRDISPSNLILTRSGLLKLIDLGIAKTRTTDVQTKTGLIRGKFGYMAPEVVRGARADQLADIYSVGVVAWEMLTARRLFGRPSEIETLESIRMGAREAPSLYNQACPPQLDDIVMRALSRAPERRWQSAADMRDALVEAALVLHEPLSLDVVRTWLTQWTNGETPTEDSPTRTTVEVMLIEPTSAAGSPVASPPALSVAGIVGTSSPAARALPAPAAASQMSRATRDPALELRRAAEIANQRLAREIARRRRLSWIMVLSLVVNLTFLVTVVAIPDHGVAIAEMVPSPAPRKRKARRATRKRPAKSKRTQPRELAEAPPFVSGEHPRSSSSRARYSARLCIDRWGRVKSAWVRSGPKRLHGRIRHRLLQWRFAPHRELGKRVSACFDVRNRLRASR